MTCSIARENLLTLDVLCFFLITIAWLPNFTNDHIHIQLAAAKAAEKAEAEAEEAAKQRKPTDAARAHGNVSHGGVN